MPNTFLRKFVTLVTSFIICIPFSATANDILSKDTQTTLNKLNKIKTDIEPDRDITNILPPATKKASKEPTEIYFSADEMESDQTNSTVTALGNVEIIRDAYTIKADKIIYNQNTDTVYASGNVVILEESGNVLFSDNIKLSDHMNAGEMDNIKLIMADKTKIAAAHFKRNLNNKKIMTNAVYSPCDTCRKSNPLWQIKAKKIEHNPETQDIHYQHAFLEFKGVPVIYTPFFSHPDPQVKHRSGFLFPHLKSNDYLGGAIQPLYFWDISEQENILFNPIISSKKGIVYGANYNKYFYRGELKASGSYLHDPDNEDSNRGNLFAKARYEINDYWVANTNINYASDNAYLKDLSLPKRDDTWLTSDITFQGFDFRNYAAIEAFYYDKLSYNMRNVNAPRVLPLLTYENISAPNSIGLYNKNTFNLASVYHEEDNDSHRLTMINAWNLPYTGYFGEKYKFSASLKSDIFHIENNNYSENNLYSGTTTRFMPQLGAQVSMPFVRSDENSQQIIEPIAVLALAPNQHNEIDKIPNDDSQDVELNDSNVLSLDRYSGYDRNDTGSRISYGLSWSSFNNYLGHTSALFAQSYEFDKAEGFMNKDGERDNLSDYIGRIYAAPNKYFDMNYRFKLNKDDGDVTYSELSSSIGSDLIRLYVSYTLFGANQTSSVEYGKREELYTSLNMKLTKNWDASIYNRQDLAPNGGTLEQGGELIYEDECSRFIFSIEKDFSNDPNYKGDVTFGINFYLKTLGGVGTK